MSSWLLLLLAITGVLAIYWVLFGQWKYNAMLRDSSAENAKEPVDVKKDDKTDKN